MTTGARLGFDLREVAVIGAGTCGFRGLKANIGGQLEEAVAIYAGGRTGPNEVAGQQVLDLMPCPCDIQAMLRGRYN